MGFYELKDSGLPAVPWKYFNNDVQLDNKLLWTVRVAVDKGEDLNLPRIVGMPSKEAMSGALDLYKKYKNIGMVIYYPYFIADKSGTLKVSSDEIVIEAVEKDLWNLVTYNKKNVTIISKIDGLIYDGDKSFLSNNEMEELHFYATNIRKKFRDYMTTGKTLLLEWSYAYNTNIDKTPVGDKYLVFYEIREI